MNAPLPGEPRRPGDGQLVLGVDPGTRRVGFAVVLCGARPVMREFGAIRLSPRDPLPRRLGEIHRALGEIISRHRPAVVAVEEVFYGKNFQSAIKIGEARGVTLLAGAMAGLPVVEYSPAMVKKSVTGNGRADKRQVQRMVARLLGISEPPEPLDASDALAIAFCHASRMGRAALAPQQAEDETPLQKAIRSLKRSRNHGLERRIMSTKSTSASSRSEEAATARPGVIMQSELPGIRLINRGKVRDLYDLGEHLLLLATDRLSAFDVVLPDPIPDKGKVLTRLSVFWFEMLGFPNHLVTADPERMPASLAPHRAVIRDRALLVRRLQIFPIECVVRGYLAGSGWNEYRQRGSVCGVPLPPGLVESGRLPEPIFTPTTKAAAGHDEPMTFQEVEKTVGAARAAELRDKSIEVYRKAAEHARKQGIIICDTKFEWGIPLGAPLDDPRAAPAVLADEVLTPDSSRFWPQDGYRPGGSQPSYDKQYVRDYLLTLKWDKRPPGPKLPAAVIERTSRTYREIFERLTGKSWA